MLEPNGIPPQPIFPRPAPFNKHFIWRLLKGARSWLDLLSDVDFQIPVGAVQFLGLNLFLVNDPATVKRLLIDKVDKYPKHPYTLWILEPLIGRAIFSVNGEEWARQRRLMDQAFQVAQLRRVFPQMQGAVDAMVDRIDSTFLSSGTNQVSLQIDQEMTLVTADVIVRTILSRPLSQAEAVNVFDAFVKYQRRAGQALILRFLRLPQKRLQLYLGRHARTIRQWIDCSIRDRLQAVNQCHTDLLQALIDAHDTQTNSSFSREELLDQVCFLFLAGHETSASALGMATYLLATIPDAQLKMRKELDDVLGDRTGPLTYDDLRRMPYAAAVFNETLRLYPPVTFFIREAQEEDHIVDRRCPFRSLTTISPWVVHRQEGQWPNPHGFSPDRFLQDSASSPERKLARDAWLPFGLGPRKCPGAAFALQEAILVLAELVRRYELLPDAGGHQPELVARLTLRSKNGIRVQLKKLEADGAMVACR